MSYKNIQELIYNNLTDAILVFDKNLVVLQANEAMYKLYRKFNKKNTLEKKHIKELSPLILPEKIDIFNEILTQKTVRNYENTEFIYGHLYFSETTLIPIIVDDQVEQILVTVRDISKHKKRERELQKRALTFESFMKQSAEGLVLCNRNATILEWNQRMADLSGYQPDEIIGRNLFEIADLLLPSTKLIGGFKKQLEYILEQIFITDVKPNVLPASYQLVAKSGINYFIDLSLFPIETDSGFFIGIIVRDITVQHKIAKSEQEHRLMLLNLANSAFNFLQINSHKVLYDYLTNAVTSFVENSSTVYIVFDDEALKGKIVSMGGDLMQIFDDIEKAEENSGLDLHIKIRKVIKAQLLSGTFKPYRQGTEKLMSRLFIPELLPRIEPHLAGKTGYYSGIVNSDTLYGGLFLFSDNELSSELLQFLNTFVRQASVAVNRLYIEKELIEARRKAEEADRLKSAFLANMSHEIRNPMSSLIGFADLLMRQHLPEKPKRYAAIINKNAQHLLQLINDIIDISKIEAGQVQIEKNYFPVNNLLSELKEQYILQTRDNENLIIDTRLTMADNEDIIFTDEFRVKQILMNLISNAMKFTETGTIEFGYDIESNFIRFFVSDTGIGISDSKKEAIFKRFVQEDGSIAKRYGGTGLGLSISRGLVNILGGEIWLDSEKGKGTTFYFTIPYQLPTNKRNELSNDEIKFDLPNWSDKSILVIDSNQNSYLYLEALLELCGAKILFAKDMHESYNYIHEKAKVDMILLDTSFGDQHSGLHIAKLFAEKRSKTPVIAYTANTSVEMEQKCIAAGCKAYLIKPIQAETFYKTLQEHMI